MQTSKKVGLGIVISIVSFFGIMFAAVALTDDETKERWAQEIEEDELKRIQQEKIESEKQEQKELAKQEALRIEQMKQLPDSCNGVNSIEVDLYPTGKQCLEALDNRVTDWCNSNSDYVEDCRTQFYLKLAETCEDAVFSSVEVCLMHTFQEVYFELIP